MSDKFRDWRDEIAFKKVFNQVLLSYTSDLGRSDTGSSGSQL